MQDRIAIAFGGGIPVVADAGPASFSAIQDALGDIALCRDMDGLILSANRTFCELIGIDDPVGRSCAELGIVFQPGRLPHSHDVEFTVAGVRRIFLWQDVVIRDPLAAGPVVQSVAREVTEERRRAEAGERARRAAEERERLEREASEREKKLEGEIDADLAALKKRLGK